MVPPKVRFSMRTVRLSLLAALCAMPLVQVRAASVDGSIRGVLRVDGRPVTGVELALVDLDSGAIKRTRSGRGGAFEMRLPPGRYVAAVRSRGRLAVSRGPSRVSVSAGRESALRLELVELSAVAPQEAVAPAGSTLATMAAAGISPQQFPGPGPKPCPSPNKHSTCGGGN